MSAVDKKQTLIWIDLEMTGQIPETDRIIEIATLVTDGNLNVMAEGPVLAVKQSDAALAAMDDWNQRTHGASGLIERVRNSVTRDAEAQAITLDFLRQYSERGASPMRQQHLSGPPLPGALHAGAGSLLPLPQSGCEHGEGAGAALGAAGAELSEQAHDASGHG